MKINIKFAIIFSTFILCTSNMDLNCWLGFGGKKVPEQNEQPSVDTEKKKEQSKNIKKIANIIKRDSYNLLSDISTTLKGQYEETIFNTVKITFEKIPPKIDYVCKNIDKKRETEFIVIKHILNSISAMIKKYESNILGLKGEFINTITEYLKEKAETDTDEEKETKDTKKKDEKSTITEMSNVISEEFSYLVAKATDIINEEDVDKEESSKKLTNVILDAITKIIDKLTKITGEWLKPVFVKLINNQIKTVALASFYSNRISEVLANRLIGKIEGYSDQIKEYLNSDSARSYAEGIISRHIEDIREDLNRSVTIEEEISSEPEDVSYSGS